MGERSAAVSDGPRLRLFAARRKGAPMRPAPRGGGGGGAARDAPTPFGRSAKKHRGFGASRNAPWRPPRMRASSHARTTGAFTDALWPERFVPQGRRVLAGLVPAIHAKEPRDQGKRPRPTAGAPELRRHARPCHGAARAGVDCMIASSLARLGRWRSLGAWIGLCDRGHLETASVSVAHANRS